MVKRPAQNAIPGSGGSGWESSESQATYLAEEYAERAEYKYLAFISYGSDRDVPDLTPSVHLILGQLLRNASRKGAPEEQIFIDLTEIAVGDDLEPTIFEALDDSANLIVVASERSKHSKWVPLEVSYWLKRHARERVYFVVLDRSKAEPLSLEHALRDGLPEDVLREFPHPEHRLVVDLRGLSPETKSLEKSTKIRLALSKLAAPMLDVEVRQMVDADILARKRTVRRHQQWIAALAVMLVATITFAGVAVGQRAIVQQQRREALAQRDVAVAVDLASQAENLAAAQPNLAKQLALTAYDTAPTQPAAQAAVLETAEASGLLSLPTRAAASAVSTLAESPNGQLLAVALAPSSTGGGSSQSAVVDLWDLRTHHLDWSVPAEDNTPIAFSPTGDVLAMVGIGNIVDLYDVANPTTHAVAFSTFSVDGTLTFASPTVLALSPNGRMLAAVTASQRTIWMFNIANPAHPVPYATPVVPAITAQPGYYAAVFTPDSSTLVLAGSGGEVTWWSVRHPSDPSLLASSPFESAQSAAIAISPDGRTVGVATGNSILLWDMTDPARPLGPRVVSTGVRTFVNDLAFSPDGTVLAATSPHQVSCWKMIGPGAVAPLPALPEPSTSPTALAFGSDGDTVLAGNTDGTVASWRLPADRGVADIPVGTVAQLAFSPNGKLLAGADSDRTVWLWDASDPRRLRRTAQLPVGASAVTAVAFAPTGSLLATGAGDGTVRLWDIAQPSHAVVLATIPTEGSAVAGLAFDPRDGGTLAVAAVNGTATLWRVADPRDPVRLGTIPGQGSLSALEFAPSGRSLALLVGNGVTLWDVADPRKPTAQGSIGTDQDQYGYDALAYSPDGRTLACAGRDGVIQLWDVAEPAKPAKITDLSEPGVTVTAALAYSADGARLVGVYGAGVAVWSVGDPQQAQPIGVLPGPATLDALALDPVDGYAAAAGLSGTVLDTYVDPAAAASSMCAMVGTPITASQWTEDVPDLDYAPPCEQRGAAS